MMQVGATLGSCSSQVGAVPLVNVGNAKAVSRRPLLQKIGVQRLQRPLSTLRAQAQPTEKSDKYVDYAGKQSVFPAEACEETGENCGAEGVFQEVQPSASATKPTAEQQPGPDREYQDYTGDKTVFPGEACDDLGGDFCDPKFQDGVFPEKVEASTK